MPRHIPQKPDTFFRNAKPEAQTKRISDGGGLFLLVEPDGRKRWRFQYSNKDGKRNTLSFGDYPTTTVADARAHAEQARKLLARGVDPSEFRKATKAARVEAVENTFEAVAREWFIEFSKDKAASHSAKIIRRFEVDVFPWIGKRPISDLKPLDVLTVVKRIVARGVLETAHRAQQNIGQVMRYAVQHDLIESDPTRDLKGAIAAPTEKHHAALLEPREVAEFLRACSAFKGTLVVQSALALAPLVFVRPGELRKAKWADFDLEGCTWKYFVTKTKTQHLVPLSRQAVAILTDLHALTGNRDYVFPGSRDPKRPMSDAAVNAALRRMGYDTQTQITGHGFRAMARTLLAEQLRIDPQVIEHQLAHKVADALGTAYNRTKFIDERTAMMQAWADYLDKLKAGADVLPLTRAA